jgi:hypothetical protein
MRCDTESQSCAPSHSARVEDVLQGKVWAVQDSSRRGSKRQKDLADIARILEK